jgi:hypothetical protein
MIVVVMCLGENAECRMEFADQLDRPDLIHPKVVEGRANSDQEGCHADKDAERDKKKFFRGAPGSQSFSERIFERLVT